MKKTSANRRTSCFKRPELDENFEWSRSRAMEKFPPLYVFTTKEFSLVLRLLFFNIINFLKNKIIPHH